MAENNRIPSILDEARHVSNEHNMPEVTVKSVILSILDNKRAQAGFTQFTGFNLEQTWMDISELLQDDHRAFDTPVIKTPDVLPQSKNVEKLYENISVSWHKDTKKIGPDGETAHEMHPELWILATIMHLFPKSQEAMLLERQGVTLDRLAKYVGGEDPQRILKAMGIEKVESNIYNSEDNMSKKRDQLNRLARSIANTHNALVTEESLALALLESKNVQEFLMYDAPTFERKSIENVLRKDLDQFGKTYRNEIEQIKSTLEVKNLNNVQAFGKHGSAVTDNLKIAEQSASMKNLFAKHYDVTALGVLIWSLPESKVTGLFSSQGVTEETVSNFLNIDLNKVLEHVFSQNPDTTMTKDLEPHHIPQPKDGYEGTYDPNVDTGTPTLDKFSEDMVALATSGAYTPTIGRNDEVRDTLRILRQKKKSNPMLLGEAGVGKSAIVEGIAMIAAKGELPEDLKDIRLLSLDINTIMAGTKYRGELEERLKAIREEAEGSDRKVIFFLDETHTMMDILETFKPALARGSISVIGATTNKEYKTDIQPNTAMDRRFDTVTVNEPSRESTLDILMGSKSSYEDHHNCVYSQEAIEAIMNLSEENLLNRFSADREITILDKVGAIVKETAKENLTFDEKSQRPIATSDMVKTALSSMTGVDLSRTKKEIILGLEATLKEKIIGQDNALQALSDAVIRSQSGLGESEKPEGTFLFTGPTGVGKTEAIKVISKELKRELVRFDMGEFSEAHSVSKLFGSPPGYVGSTEGGRMTEAVKKHPNALFLLDEVEKAHPVVFNALLQVLDDGRMTDGVGETANFRKSMIVMTANAGAAQAELDAQDAQKDTIGFVRQSEEDKQKEAQKVSEKTIEENLKKIFAPEFRNRLDSIVQFNPLTVDNVKDISPLIATQVSERSEKANKWSISFNKVATDWLAEKGFDRTMGARPLKRAFMDHVETPLARQIFEQDLEGTTGIIHVSVNDTKDRLSFDFQQSASNDNKEQLLLDATKRAHNDPRNKNNLG